MAPVTSLADSETPLPLRHRRVLQLPLLGSRRIRLLAVYEHNNDIGISGLPVIGAHQCVLRIGELPAELEEVGL